MAYSISGGCPACNHQLMIAKYRCPNCRTEISGQFEACRFCHLDPHIQNFILVFIAQRGNIKLVEKELGISYPTVKKNLQMAIDALGLSSESGKSSVSYEEKMEILDRLEKGEIDYHTAMAILENNE
ncbi:MAG: DUF2089 domain-containing protein [bacterium]